MLNTIAIIAVVLISVVSLAIILSIPFAPDINAWMNNRMYARNIRRAKRDRS